MYATKYFIYFIIVTYIICNELPTFEITSIYHEQTRCDQEKGLFQFVILGKGNNIKDNIRITLSLKLPEDCKADCEVSSSEMFCTMDALAYDLSGEKRLEVFTEEPIFDNLKMINWSDYFSKVNPILNDATNCKSNERPPEELIFAAYDKNIEILGCFRNKNNFSFQLTLIKDEKNTIEDSLNEDIYFEINFEKPKIEKSLCVIPKNNINGVYTIRCAIEYGGEIEVGIETSSTVKLNGKNLKIVIRGLLIQPTIVDECTDEKNKV